MINPTVPPRFVPTLTDIYEPPLPAGNRVDSELVSQAMQLEEQMFHRVMQRVDLVLDRRLREALGQVILAQTQNLVPLLREEIELVVRESVSQAIAQELPFE